MLLCSDMFSLGHCLPLTTVEIVFSRGCVFIFYKCVKIAFSKKDFSKDARFYCNYS